VSRLTSDAPSSERSTVNHIGDVAIETCTAIVLQQHEPIASEPIVRNHFAHFVGRTLKPKQTRRSQQTVLNNRQFRAVAFLKLVPAKLIAD
jgi:hypothetical protein